MAISEERRHGNQLRAGKTHPIGFAVQHQSWHIQHRRGVQQSLIRIVIRVAERMAPAVLVGVQSHLGPIRVLKAMAVCSNSLGKYQPLGAQVSHMRCENSLPLART